MRGTVAIAAALFDPLVQLSVTLAATGGCYQLFRPAAFPLFIRLCRWMRAGVLDFCDSRRRSRLRVRYRLILRVLQDSRRRKHCPLSPAWQALEDLRPPPPLLLTLAAFTRSALGRFTSTAALLGFVGSCGAALTGPLIRAAATRLAWAFLWRPACSLAARAGRRAAAGARSLLASRCWLPGCSVIGATPTPPPPSAAAPHHPFDEAMCSTKTHHHWLWLWLSTARRGAQAVAAWLIND